MRNVAWLTASIMASVSYLSMAEETVRKTQVKMAWPEGSWVMTIASQTEGTTTIGDENVANRDRSTQVWQIDVGKTDDKDEKRLRMRLVEMVSEGQSGGDAYRYDSTKDGQDKGEQDFVYQPLMAAEVGVLLDADDMVIEAGGLGKLWDELADKAVTDAQRSLLAEMKTGMNDKSFEVQFRRLESLMPRSPVAVGDNWKSGVRLDLPIIGELKARYDCKLAAMEKSAGGDLAVIEASSQYTQSSPKASSMMGVDVTLSKVDLEEKTRLAVSSRTGLVVRDECQRTATVAGKAKIEGAEHEFVSRTTTAMTTTLTPGPYRPGQRTDTAASRPAGTQPSKREALRGTSARSSGKKPVTVVLRRQWEPRQKAFTVLVPVGWQVEGGLFSVDPTAAGGVLNSIETKCDFTVKRDAAGTVLARWAPTYNFVDFSRGPEFANLAGMFPPGAGYNGALVKPMPTVEEYLSEGFKQVRPQATGVSISQRSELPELAQILSEMSKGVNASMVQLGKAPMTFTAGVVVFDYQEGGRRYREAAATALCDFRAAAAIWSNQFTFHMRAPADEADEWKPVLDIIRQSLRIDPQWLAAYVKAVGQRGQEAAEVFRMLARIDQEILERRSKSRSDIQHENYLLLTGQEEYVNPFTKETERDTSDYRQRWTNPAGDRIYSNIETFDPNKDPDLNRLEWKLTPVHPR
jgi:hypothetical protein